MITNRRDTLIRSMWVVGLAGVLGIFARGIPQSLAIARLLSEATQAQLDRLGVPAGLPGTYLIVVDTLLMLFFAGVATVLLWKRPGQRMAQISAVMLLLTAALYTAPAYEAPIPIWAKALLSSGAEVAQVAFLFSFPNGRFVPRWMAWALIPIALWRFAIWNFLYLPNLFALERTGESYPFLPQSLPDLLLFFCILLCGIGVQVYRYRRIDTPTERQQVKWLMWGTLGTVVVVGSYVLLLNLAGDRLPVQSELLGRLAARTLRHAALALVPVSLLYSILHHRLWDIDTLVNRTLVYGVLTGLLALLFGGLIVLLQVVFTPRTDTAYTFVVALTTLLTVVLARPLYRRVQESIDRRFNRRTWEAQHAIAQMRMALRDQVALDQLAGGVLAVARETWQPESLSLWIPAGRGKTERPSVRYRIDE